MLSEKQLSSINRIASENGFKQFSFRVDPGSKKGDNYLGTILLVTLTSADRTKTLIIKCADTNPDLRKQFPLQTCYEREVFAYTTLIPTILSLQDEFALPHPSKAFAKIHDFSLDNLSEYLIFDDMKSLGFRMQNRKKTMDHDHIELVIKEMAKLHSLSFVLKHFKPEKYKELSGKLTNYLHDQYAKWMYMIETKLRSVLKYFENNSEVVKVLETYQENLGELFKDTNEDEYNLVIIHGDSWCNNMMFKYDDMDNSQKPTDFCFLDWQITRVGSPAYDLCYFLFFSASKQILDNHKEYLLLYHKIIEENLRSVGCSVDKIFPYEILEKHWKLFCKVNFIISLSNLDLLLRNEEDTETLSEMLDEKKFEDETFNVPRSEEYYDRIFDIISMLAKYKYY